MTGLDPHSRQQVLVAVVQDEGRAVKQQTKMVFGLTNLESIAGNKINLISFL